MTRLRLKEYLTIVPSGESSFLLQGGEGETFRLRLGQDQQETLHRLLDFLQEGGGSEEDVLQQIAAAGHDPDLARRILGGLRRVHLVEEVAASAGAESTNGDRDQALFLSRFTDDGGSTLQEKLRRARVDVVHSGYLSDRITDSLVHAGIGSVGFVGTRDEVSALEGPDERPVVELDRDGTYPSGSDLPDLLVVSLESWHPALLESVNDFAMRTGTPWLLVQNKSPKEGTVGPLFVPGVTSCYRCLTGRLKGNMSWLTEFEELEELLRRQRRRSRHLGALRPGFDALAGIAGLEVLKFLTELDSPRLAGAFCTVNWFSLKTEVHEVLRIPRCSSCRPPRVEIFPWKTAPIEEKVLPT